MKMLIGDAFTDAGDGGIQEDNGFIREALS